MFIKAATLILVTVTAVAMPPRIVVEASGEIVSFVSLLMAGLLPAMILTATVLKGDAFSSAKVRSYGDALRSQLKFWASLFALAIATTFAITLAKIFLKLEAAPFGSGWFAWVHPDLWIARLLVGISAACLATILLRLWPAYRGLLSVLNLTVTMAEVQATVNDRKLADSYNEKIERLKGVGVIQKAEWPE